MKLKDVYATATSSQSDNVHNRGWDVDALCPIANQPDVTELRWATTHVTNDGISKGVYPLNVKLDHPTDG